ncbi:hypothetical protein [Arthrobacter sp. SLBN-53]|uniref:hypothetical protein n=1 Tax=Arthrobacter sp. SLBN-53 TaxID=2768412 RepID=UPI001C20578A|nr:hypothetical protein [Arthrobacter sp. SLBN-53]
MVDVKTPDQQVGILRAHRSDDLFSDHLFRKESSSYVRSMPTTPVHTQSFIRSAQRAQIVAAAIDVIAEVG